MSLGVFLARLSKLLLVLCMLPFLHLLSRHVIDILCIFGAAYLLWSAMQILAAPSPFDAQQQLSPPSGSSQMILSGFVLSWSNPKTILFVATIFPRFLVESDEGMWSIEMQLIMLGFIWMLVNLITEMLYISAASYIRRHIGRYHRLVAPTTSSILMVLAFLLIADGPLLAWIPGGSHAPGIAPSAAALGLEAAPL